MNKPLLHISIALLGLCLCSTASAYRKPDGEYFNILPLFWSKIYPSGGATLYCGRKFGANKGRAINIEHVFPMSWTLNRFRCRDRNHCRRTSPEFNRVEADMHNLYPSRKDINQARSSYAFALLKGERRRFGQCDFELDQRRRRVEPRPTSRGNIARAMFYMHHTYGFTIYGKQGHLLKQWHRQDPPDAEEQRRNNAIEKIQGTRNKFIDRPGLAYELKF
ncbi:MAG: endonuclease I [Gammaproteobacteria bacterium]|nr:endonuclease I [Gammaproteobacteria bacterium]